MNEQRAKRKWAALVYIAGDNDLSERGLRDVEEICSAKAANPGGDGLNSLYIGIEIDTKGEHTGSIRYEVNDDGHRVVIDRLPERDTGSPKTLSEFFRWGVGSFPAENYLVVIWGHGTGFKSTKAVAGDDYGTWLDIPGILWALQQAECNPAVLGFDACLMGMAEIAYAFRDSVGVLVGSQQVEWGDGWPYEAVMKDLADARKAETPEALAREIVGRYIAQCRKEGRQNVTHSAMRLERIEPLIESLGRLGVALTASSGPNRSLVATARSRSLGFNMADYVDLGDFCRNLENDAEIGKHRDVVAAAAEVRQLAEGKDGVILKSETYGAAMERARGLSVWFPADPVQFARYRDTYITLASRVCKYCGRVTLLGSGHKAGCSAPVSLSAGLEQWAGFLERYHGFSQLPAPSPQPAAQPSTGIAPTNQP